MIGAMSEVERRKGNVFRAIAVPVVVAVITGVSAGYLAVRIALAVLETRIGYLESDLVRIKDTTLRSNDNRTELARRGEWIIYQSKRMDSAEKNITILLEQSKDRYTKSDAEKDFERLQLRLEKMMKEK